MNAESPSLIRAASNGDADAVRALLAAGASVNTLSAGGQTALMLAAIFGNEEIAKILLLSGADTTVRDPRGLSAQEWAIRRGFHDVARLIENHSGQKPIARKPSPAATQRVEAKEPDRLPQGPASRDSTPTPKMGGAAAAILRNHVARAAQDEAISKAAESPVSQDLVEQPLTETIPEIETAPPIEVREDEQPQVLDFTAEQYEQIDVTEIETAPETTEGEAVEDDGVSAANFVPFVPQPSHEVDTAPAVLSATEPAQKPIVEEPDLNQPAPVADELPPPLADPLPHIAPEPSPIPKFNAPEQTQPPRMPAARSVPPSFLAQPNPPSSSSRPIIWLLVIVTLGASAFGAYQLNNYLSRSEPAPAVATQPVQPPVTAPVKPRPVVAGDLAGAEVDVPEPDYPEAAKGKSGEVTVRVQVNRSGKVVSARAVAGEPELRRAAVAAARKATFSSEKLGSNRRTTAGTITYKIEAPQTTPSAESQAANAPSPTATSTPQSNESAASAEPLKPVTGGPLAGTEENLPVPEYPANARRNNIQEVITITVRVNRAGNVISWRTGTGDASLRAAALKAARRSKFSPSKLPGTGEVVGTITYNFKL